jgi:hypothetical protein
VLPRHSLVPDLRSAAALAPIDYYRLIAEGRILPHHAELLGFSPEAVQLGDGSEIPCDLVVLSVGNQTPSFPFLPPSITSGWRRKQTACNSTVT